MIKIKTNNTVNYRTDYPNYANIWKLKIHQNKTDKETL